MSRKINKELISDISDNLGFKSSATKNPDLSQNTLISNNLHKKMSDKKSNSSKKIMTSEKMTKKRKRSEDSIYNLDNLENDLDFSTRQEKKKSAKKKKEKSLQNIIVDDIENIYISLIGKSSFKLAFQTVIILLISFGVNLCHWIYLFSMKSKLENNYCLSKLNQFDNCIPEEICESYEEKLNLFVYNDTLDIHNNSLNEHQNFIIEQNDINYFYKQFFVAHNYNISKDKLITNIDMTKHKTEKINFVIILTKREKYDMFLKFFNICLKEKLNFYIILIILIGGILGSVLFGLLADIYGRKKIISVLLALITISFTCFTVLSFKVDEKYEIYYNKFSSVYPTIPKIHQNILAQLYGQDKAGQYFEKYFIIYILLLLILCLSLRPLGKICLAILLENSITDLNVLVNFRIYTFVTTGLPPLSAFLIFIMVNNIITTLLILTAFFFVLFLLSIFFVNESMRYHYEYSQWKELTNEIMSLYKIDEEFSVNFKNKMEYEAFRLEEYRKMNSKFIQRINSIFSFVKHRIYSLNRDIRRNSAFIIKNEEVVFNPLIIYSSIAANRNFNKLKYLLIIILIIIYCQVFFIEKELVDFSFFNKAELYFDKDNNYIINSNYFILAIITFISNYFFYLCYRISCFKHIFYTSLVIVTFLMILFYYLSGDPDDYPLDINQTGFNMLENYYKVTRNRKLNVILFFIYFFLNGINYYINILAIKLTNTLYRCSMFGINTILSLLSMAFGQAINYQIQNYFFLIGGLNTIGIISEFYFGELKGIPNIINDLKQNVNRDNDKNKEKMKKL